MSEVAEEVESIDESSLYVTEEELATEEPPVEEIQEEVSDFEVPSKFKDKPLEDVIKSYQELETAYGRRNNEIGDLRKLTDELLQLKLNDKPPVQEEKVKVDVDSLLNEPDRVLEEVVGSNSKVKALEDKLLQLQRKDELKAFEAKHEDWQETMNSPEFADWIQSSPVRHRMFMEANSNYDYTTGSELLTLFKDTRAVKVEEGKSVREERAKKAMKSSTAEKGSSGAVRKPVFKRLELIQLKMKNPAKYEAMLPEIMEAYRDKRVR